MNKTRQFFSRGLWIFSFMIAGMLVLLYAIQSDNSPLLFVCIIFCFIFALGLMMVLLQADKTLDKKQIEIAQLEQHLNVLLQKDQQTANDHQQQEQSFKTDEMLARIMPATETHFNSVVAFNEKLLQNIAKELDIVQGLVYVLNDADNLFHMSGEYAYFSEGHQLAFPLGENLSGQVAKNKKMLNLKELPEGYITILSGLGKSAPRHLIITPILHADESIGIMELASFKPFGENEELLVRKISEEMANLLNELRS